MLKFAKMGPLWGIRARLSALLIGWWDWSVTCDRSVVFIVNKAEQLARSRHSFVSSVHFPVAICPTPLLLLRPKLYGSSKLESHLISTEFLISIEQGDDVFDWSVGLNVVCGTENIATIAS